MSRRNTVLCAFMSVAVGGAIATSIQRTSRPHDQNAFAIAGGPELEPNRGQATDGVLFLSTISGAPVQLTREGARLVVAATDGRGAPLDLRFAGARTDVAVRAEEALSSRSHYYRGSDRRAWIRDVPHFRRVVYEGVWPGVDVAFHDAGPDLEYDFVVAPGADAARIALVFPGADDVRVDPGGDLVLRAAGREIRQRPPRLYQDVGGARRAVAGGFRHLTDGRVVFTVGAYDRSRALVIDPTLAFSTYRGGARGDQGVNGVAMDATGDVYACGFTPWDGDSDPPDAYLNKYSPSGAVLWRVQLGGPGGPADRCSAVTLDGGGNVYITGSAQYWGPGRPNYPTTPNAFLSAPTTYPTTKAFVTKLDANGHMLYSTFLGGSGNESGADIAVDSEGNMYVTGSTTSTDFPTVNAAQPNSGGATDAFLAALDASGSRLLFSTYLGGSGDDTPSRLAILGPGLPGRIAIAGYTNSRDLPVRSAVQGSYRGGANDAFVAAYALSGVPPSVVASPAFVTYLGGSGNDAASGVAMDGTGAVIVAGWTDSSDYALVNATQTSLSTPPQADMFVTKLTNAGTALSYSTFLDVGNGRGGGLAVDTAGHAFVTGGSTFVTKLDVNPPNRLFTFGGCGGRSITMGNGHAAIGGDSFDLGDSNVRLFPVQNAAEPLYRDYQDTVGWVAKVMDGPSADPAVEEDSPQISYSGNWVIDRAARYSGGSARGAAESGAQAVISFFGTGIAVTGYRDPRSGLAQVSGVDPIHPNLALDLYSAVPEPKSLILSLDFGPPAANHTITLEATGTHDTRAGASWVWLDGFTVFNAAASPTPTGTPTPTATPTGTITRIEQDDARIAYTGTWFVNTSTSANHSGGSAQLSTDAGATATLTFTGTTITWIGLKDPWSGMANVFIDGVLRNTVDTYSATELDHTVIDTEAGLAPGAHTIQIVVTGTGDASAAQAWVWVDAFDVASGDGSSGTPPATPTVSPTSTASPASQRIEDTDPALAFGGSWFTHTSQAESGSRAHLSTEAGDSVTLSFTGTGISWIGLKDAWSGIAKVFIDGASQGTVDCYSATDRPQALVFEARNLPAGAHTIRIEVSGTHDASSAQSWVWVDAFDVTSTGGATATPTARPTATAPPSPTRIDDGAEVSFSGAWFTHASAGASWGSARLSTQTGDSATLTFTGTGVSWIGLKDAWAGIAKVFVDDIQRATVDGYSATDQLQTVMFSIHDLAAGPHTIRIEVAGIHDSNSAQSWVWVDAFDVSR